MYLKLIHNAYYFYFVTDFVTKFFTKDEPFYVKLNLYFFAN